MARRRRSSLSSSLSCVLHVHNRLLQATQTLLTRVPETTPTEFEQAVDAASQAYHTWSRQSVLSRQRFAIEFVVFCLLSYSPSFQLRLQNQIRRSADSLAASIVLEQGKTLTGK